MIQHVLRVPSIRLFLFIAFVFFFVSISQPALAADTGSGGMRYTITVSKFENRSGWSGQWDIGVLGRSYDRYPQSNWSLYRS